MTIKTMNYALVGGIVASTLLYGGLALAEESSGGVAPAKPRVAPATKDFVKERREINDDAKKDLRMINEDRRGDIGDVVKGARASGTLGTTSAWQIRQINAEAKAKAEAEKQARKEALEQNRIEFKNRLIEIRKHQITAYTERTIKRMNAAIERFGQIIERLESRIEKIKLDGKDTAAAETSLNEAKSLLVTASESVAEISIALTSALTATSTEEAKSMLRDSIKEASDDIKAVREELTETIKIIKDIAPPAGSATTTSSN